MEKFLLDQWTGEWPTEPGEYLFYGWQFSRWSQGFTRDENGELPPPMLKEPRLHKVSVHKTTNGISMVCDGAFFYKSEGGSGLFLKMPPLAVDGLDAKALARLVAEGEREG